MRGGSVLVGSHLTRLILIDLVRDDEDSEWKSIQKGIDIRNIGKVR